MSDVLLFLAGLCVGVMNAIAGGGGILGFPALIALGGLSPLVANGTYNVVNTISQLASAYGYRRYLRQVPRVYLLLLVPCVVGAAAGAWWLRHTSSQDFEHLVPALIAFAVLIFAIQPKLQAYLQRSIHPKRQFASPLIWIGLALLPLGLYGGYFGAGFGFIMLAFLGFSKMDDMHQMNALRNLAGVVVGLTCVVVLAPGSFIDWRAGLIMAASSAIGGYVGARLTQHITSHSLRYAIIIIGVISAGYIATANLWPNHPIHATISPVAKMRKI